MLLSLSSYPTRRRDVANEGLPPSVRQNVRRHFDGNEASIFSLEQPFGFLGRAGLQHDRSLGVQSLSILSPNEVEDPLLHQLIAGIAEEPGGSLVQIRELRIEVGKKVGVGCQ